MDQPLTENAPTMLPPPSERYNLLGWMRKNLFSSWHGTLLTLVTLGAIYLLLAPLVRWLLFEAEWEVVQVNLRLLMAGQYPAAQIWRAWLVLYLLAGIFGLTWGIWRRGRDLVGPALLVGVVALGVAVGSPARQHLLSIAAAGMTGYLLGRWQGPQLRRVALLLWVLYFPLVIVIIRGGGLLEGLLPPVSSNLWGGLMLTFLLTVVGIVFSFPIGVLLALGRRSTLPAVRWVSVAYIEIIRGVPLVTILFMASTMVPLFLPGQIRLDRVLRAMIGIIMFTSAYLAENVRGGLQAISRGQYEAAHALGLNGFQTMGLIILPQALRAVIPVIMGLFVSLFKDTSLVATIGLLELLGISRSILAQPAYVSYQHEVLLFITAIYWIISYFMSYISRRLEIRLGVGER